MPESRSPKGQFVKGNFADHTGKKVNMLTFLYMHHVRITKSGGRKPYWMVECECGNKVVKFAGSVTSGYSKSCGCLQRIATSKARKTHGEADTRLYYTWENMKKRCYNEKVHNYHRYGGKGIKMHEAWKNDYKAFSEWAWANGYNDSLTIERIDYNGDYEPNNCKWITHKEQASNRSSNLFVFIEGEKYSPIQLEKKYSIPLKTIYARIASGDKGKDVIRPLGKRRFKKRLYRGN